MFEGEEAMVRGNPIREARRRRARRAARWLPLLAASAALTLPACLGFDATEPPAARLTFRVDVAAGTPVTAEVYDENEQLVTTASTSGQTPVTVMLGPSRDYAGLRVVARAGQRVLKRIVPAVGSADRLDVGLLDGASTAAAQLVQEKVAGQGGSFSSVPPDAFAGLIEQIEAGGAEIAAFQQILAELLEGAATAGDPPIFGPLHAWLEDAYVQAKGITAEQAADYRSALAAAVEGLTVPIVCDAALVKVMFTVDISGEALDGNGAPQLIRQPPKAGKVFLAITVDESSPIADSAGLLKTQMTPNDSATVMYDDGTGGDEEAGDGVFTRVLVLPRGMRVKYKYTNGSAGEGWTRTEEWPGNARLLEVRDVISRDTQADCLVIRRDVFGDEATNKNHVNLHSKIKGSGGNLGFELDLGGEAAALLDDGRYLGGLALGDVHGRPPLTPAGVPEAQENGVCQRCPAPLTASTDDRTPPELLRAEFLSTDRIEVSFSEAMEFTSAGDSANYLIVDVAGQALPITSVAASGSRVVLHVAPPDLSQTYTLQVRRLKDASANGNPLPDGTSVTVRPDRTPPRPIAVRAAPLRDLNPGVAGDPTIGQLVVVTFDEALDPTSAENIANYRIISSIGLPLAIKAAFLKKPFEVWLVTEPQKKRRPYELSLSGVRDLSQNLTSGGAALRFFGFALFEITFAAVPGFALLDPQGLERGLPPGEGLYLTGTVLAVARDEDGNSIAVDGRTDLTGIPRFEMQPSEEQYHGQPVYKITLLAPPGNYAWKVAHGVAGEHVDPPSTLVKVHKSLCTTNDATGVNIDPVTLQALPVPGGSSSEHLDYSQAQLSLTGDDAPGPFSVPAGGTLPQPKVMFKRENPDEICSLRNKDTSCPAIVVGTWRDIEAFRVGDKTNDYDDGLPEVAPVRIAVDQQAPRLQQLTVRDSESLLLSFDERLAPGGSGFVFSARDAKTDVPLQVEVEQLGAIGSVLLPHQVLLRTAKMKDGSSYTLTFGGIADAAGNTQLASGQQTWVAPPTYVPFTPLEDTLPPKVVGVLPQAPTKLLVQFDEKVLPGPATDLANYAITAQSGSPPTIEDAVLQGGGSAVLLTTSPQEQQADYTLVVRDIADLASPPNVLGEQQVAFKGFGDSTPPQLLYAGAFSPTEVAVAFDEPVSPLTAQVAANYQLSGASVVSVELAADPARKASAFDPTNTTYPEQIVVLKTTPLTAGQSYTLTPGGVTDLSNNPCANSVDFDGVASPPLVDVVITYLVSNAETVAGQLPPRAISPATVASEREGLFMLGTTVSVDGLTKGSPTDPINVQLGGFPPEGQPLDGPEPQLKDDGSGGDAVAGDNVYTIRIEDVPLGTSIMWKAFASYQQGQSPFADATPGPSVFSDGQEFPGNENAVRILGDLDGDGVVRLENLFGDETTYKKFTDTAPFVWVVDSYRWRN